MPYQSCPASPFVHTPKPVQHSRLPFYPGVRASQTPSTDGLVDIPERQDVASDLKRHFRVYKLVYFRLTHISMASFMVLLGTSFGILGERFDLLLGPNRRHSSGHEKPATSSLPSLLWKRRTGRSRLVTFQCASSMG